MGNIQLYAQPIENYYSEDQIRELEQPLDERLIKTRKEGNQLLRYIQGHTAIDQANRIFGYGNWGWRVLSCEPHAIVDPLTGEGIGVTYRARVEVWVRGMEGSIVDVGSQPVAVSSVEEQVVGRRINDAKAAKKPVDDSPFTPLEKKNARAVIVKAHEQAEKGAATDALKRALRALGNQFANGLYGDGQVDLGESATTVVEERQHQRQLQPPSSYADLPISEQQLSSIRKLCEHLSKPEPENVAALSLLEARKVIQQLTDEYKALRQREANKQPSPLNVLYERAKAMNQFPHGKDGAANVEAFLKWCEVTLKVAVNSQKDMTPERIAACTKHLDNAAKPKVAPTQAS